MAQITGWILLFIILIGLVSQFLSWRKLRELKSRVDQKPNLIENEMPKIKYFGSYRKGLKWVNVHHENLPEDLKVLANHAKNF